jgi:uncharacterized membrane protein YkvI
MDTYLFRVILIPAGVFLAVMFGGGSASGLEVMTYFSSSGPLAGLVGLAINAIVLGTVIFLVYELGRLNDAYDYKSFSTVILGKRLSPAYEVFITIAMFLSLAYAATTGGTALANHFGVPKLAVTALLLVIVVFLTYQGRRIVEMSMVGTSIALLVCGLTMAVTAMLVEAGQVAANLTNNIVEARRVAGPLLTYTVAITAYTPIVLYAARDLRTRSEAAVAGYVSGVIFTLPLLFMHLTFLSRWPQVLQQDIPNQWIAGEIMPNLFSDIFVVVLFVAIVQTGVGLLQGFLERIDNWSVATRTESLSRRAHATIAAVALTACLLLSNLGVVSLLGKLFAFVFWASLFVFVIPLIVAVIFQFRTQK